MLLGWAAGQGRYRQLKRAACRLRSAQSVARLRGLEGQQWRKQAWLGSHELALELLLEGGADLTVGVNSEIVVVVVLSIASAPVSGRG